MSHETPPSSLLAVEGEERREGNKAEVDKKWPSLITKALSTSAVLYGSGVDGSWDPSGSLTAPREASGRVFSGKESVTGCWLVFSRACHAAEEEEVGSPVQAGPTEVGGTCCVPKALPGRQQGTGSRIPGAGCGGVSTLGAFGNG